MNPDSKPKLVGGAIAGALLTLPLIALFYLAQQLVGTAFVPFDLFDWLARVLPGNLVAFGINLIVSGIVALNLEDTARTAKTAEHILALIIFLALGIASGVGLFVYLRRRQAPERNKPGLVLGANVGLFLGVVSFITNQSASAGALISLIFTIGACLVWGMLLSRIYAHLALLPGDIIDQTLPNTARVLNRRQFMARVGGATAVVTVIGAGLAALLNSATGSDEDLADTASSWSNKNKLPNADDSLQTAPGTRKEFTAVRDHYRIDINSLPPVVRENDWHLMVSGLVEKPLQLKLDDLRKYPPLHQFITLSCISNPVGGDLISTQRWTGVSLKRILADAQPKGSGQFLRITASDGFDEVVSRAFVEADERIMLTYAWDDLPLPIGHGFPLRIYIPDRYGMKQPKWIERIEVVETEEEGYWVRRGWDVVARVQSTSVIDTVATGQIITLADRKLVPVGGIAYAGERGISKVEVQVDGGEWLEAKLRAPISKTTWVIWRYDWPFAAGYHTFTVRCTDGGGVAQIVQPRGERPSGATGLNSQGANL